MCVCVCVCVCTYYDCIKKCIYCTYVHVTCICTVRTYVHFKCREQENCTLQVDRCVRTVCVFISSLCFVLLLDNYVNFLQ